ncbi:class A beta-lactamase-related serine hydrolase [Salinadaptatus halalkaliphilus]|uniref:Class A beta-lactamase-related serine hydrolase n=1 Tax=Salinadaptatus halalkaliphilus TaxID=2419781 RepID=A0A4S3TRQ4_9EURY|nr:serine hydrolase domain-containing protein [Salinadaptatus halalkaliphilus]THE66350.1 class A beta-lactamase-related serine hydrolase [Salinadaptatus halalkaliphilus]
MGPTTHDATRVADSRPRVEERNRVRSTVRAVVLVIVVSSLLVTAISGPAVAAAGIPNDDRAETDDVTDERVVADDPEELEAFVDDVIAEQRDEHDVPGATVAVVEGDDVVLTKGYGEADVKTGTPVRANETAFMVGSVGKLVTWTAVMQGVEDGVLDLDADVNTYLEDSDVDVPDTYDEPVTLRHLGTHTDGFDATPTAGMVTEAEDVTSLETALVENRPERVRPPGETAGYSNYGAMLAGHVVAEAYDTTFEEYVQAEIFGPLEMTHSTFAQPVPADHPGDLASPHANTGDGVEPAERTYINWLPAGSMSATGEDMAAFTSAHLENGSVGDAQMLEPETIETMHETHYERHPAINDWRYGFYEYGSADDDLLAHSGGTMHETSKLVLAPADDVGIFVSYNVRNEGAPPSDVVDEILAEYDLASDPGEPDEADDATAQRADDVAGEYRTTMLPENGPMQALEPMTRLSIEAIGDGRLESDTLGMDRQEWVETEPYVFEEVDGTDVLVAEVDDGDIEALHTNLAPMMTYEPVVGHERTLVVGATVGGALLGFALSLLGWTGLALWRVGRRWRARSAVAEGSSRTDVQPVRQRVLTTSRARLGDPAWLARAAGRALCVVSLGFGVAFLSAIGIDGELAFVTMALPMQFAFVLAPLAALLAVATAIGAALAWHGGYWSRRARIHQTVLATLGLAFAWYLVQFGLVGG